MEPQGRKLHQQAAEARESGNFTQALELTDQAMIAYERDNDKLGFAEIQADRFLTLRHLYEKTDDRNYLVLAKYAAMASVELAKESGNKSALAIPLFNLAKAQETLGNFEEAAGSYQEAVSNMESNPPEEHNRPAVLDDMRVHMTTCEYKTGDQSALERAENALSQLEQDEEISDYNKHVWVSGGHMKIAEMLRKDNPEKAKEHLQKAKEIIDADSTLTLRKAQWEKLFQTLDKPE